MWHCRDCYFPDIVEIVTLPDSSFRRCVLQDKKQTVVSRDGLTSFVGPTGVLFNHSLKASGNSELFPRLVGISPTL